MIIYRLATEPYKDDLSGTGAKMYGGRWNALGFPAIYATENISLAVLEILVRTNIRLIPPSYYLLKLDIPDSITTTVIRKLKLKKGWKEDLDYTQGMGNDFLQSGNLLMKVPSAVVDEEHNFIINPRHHDHKKIKSSAVKFSFDKRLFLIHA